MTNKEIISVEQAFKLPSQLLEESETPKDKYEVIIPERTFIVNSLEEARNILDKYKVRGISIRLLKEEREL